MTRRIPMVVAVLFVLIALLYLFGAHSYPVGKPGEVGPGLYPMVVGVFLLAVTVPSAWVVVKNPKQNGADVEWPHGVGVWRVLAVLLVTIAWVLLLSYVGDLVVTVLTVVVVLSVQGAKRWPVIGVTAIGMAVAAHVLFVNLLGVPLPQGLLFP